MSNADFTRLIPKPRPNEINTGLHALDTKRVAKILGQPRKTYTDQCQPVTNPTLKRRIITRDAGPFRVTGLDIAVISFTEVCKDIEQTAPGLYEAMGNAGMLCCRLVRGSKTEISNHSYGIPIAYIFYK
jgi:hypothetical protein